jgi:DNA gyrase subunit A
MRLEAGDQVVGMDIARAKAYVLVVTGGGFGKLTPAAPYPTPHRPGGGLRTFKLTPKSGKVAASAAVSLKQQVMIISAEGIVIQTPVKEKDPRKGITVQGRSTQGVKLQDIDAGDSVVAIACFEKEAK